jgi:GalNAc-alpha-(1->4)-GalNAc-alpha-(1->3)-diNAcBac-PP-undecaprenol alpha-1,4-N-acetyl-D-galactosaminyltransferase
MRGILFVVESLGNGGQEKQLLLLCREMLKTQMQVAVYVNLYTEDAFYSATFRELNIPVYYTPEKGIAAKISYLRSVVKTYNPQFVHSFTFHLNYLCWLATAGTPAIAIGALRSIPQYNLKAAGVVRSVLNFLLPAHLVSNNHTGVQTLRKYMPWKKMYVVENGIDTSHTGTHTPGNNGSVTTISAGRLSAEKRVHLIIETIGLLVNRGYPVTHHHWGSGPEKEPLVALIAERGLQERFMIHNETTALAAEMAKADLFIHASETEGTPNVILEAMAHSLPVITSDCGDVPYIITSGLNGVICIPPSPELFAQTAATLITHPERAANMGRQANATIHQYYSLDRYLQRTLTAYDRILAEQ